ncbi:MAG: fibronectin type III domain-containing protein [Acidobacteria bacterium]|nr:fibronectin type III domain-containing protein [Acidobacteriota bacterium]
MRRHCLILVLMVAGLAGCGKKGPPRPPLPPFPVEATAAQARQAGDMVELVLTLPAQRRDGRDIEDFRGMKIFRRVARVPEEGTAPVATSRQPPAGEEEPVKDLSDKELADLVPGGTYWLRESVAGALGDHDPDARYRLTYTVRYLLKGGGWSPPTRPVTLQSGPVVPAPSGLRAVTLNAGIQLAWTSAGDGLATAIYRRDPGGAFPFQPMSVAAPGQVSFTDPTVAVGRTYVYGARATRRNEPGAPMSDMAGPVEVFMVDRFPPAPPEDLQALVRPGGVDLFWLAGSEVDLAGYRVWRRLPEGDWTLLTPDPVSGTSFTDEDVRPGEAVVYGVSAVDRSEPPNESPRGAPVTAEVPMAPPVMEEETP